MTNIPCISTARIGPVEVLPGGEATCTVVRCECGSYEHGSPHGAELDDGIHAVWLDGDSTPAFVRLGEG